MAQWFDLAIQAFTFLAVFAVASMAQRAIGAQLTVRRRLGREEVVAMREGAERLEDEP